MTRQRNSFDDLFSATFGIVEDLLDFDNSRGMGAVNYFSGGLRSDIKEEDETFNVVVEVPGLEKEKIDINYKDNILKVIANYKDSGNTLRTGRIEWSGAFKNIDVDKMTATLKNGILFLILPKKEAAKPRRIEIASE